MRGPLSDQNWAYLSIPDESLLIIPESVLWNNLRFRYNAVNFVTAFSKAST